MAKKKIVDALSPLDAITGTLAALLIGLVGFGAVAAVVTDSFTVFDMDRDSVCVEQSISVGNDSLDTMERDAVGLRDGVTISSSSSIICQPDPDAADLALVGLTEIPTFVVFVGFLLLTQRVIRYARRHGLFSRALARKIERLGWTLLLGLLGAAITEWLAEGFLLTRLMADKSWASGSFGISVAGIIGAYGIISIGRVMARAAELQDDVDATI